MHLAVIIPAAGASARFTASARAEGHDAPRSKLDEDMGGRPVLQRTVELFTNRPEARSIIVAGPHDDDAFDDFKLRHADKLAVLGVTLVRGGQHHRWQTVQAALAHLPDACTHIAVHDAARPGTPGDLLDRLLDAAAHHPAVIPAMRITDTIKRTAEAPELAPPADPLAAIFGSDAPAAPVPRRVAQTLDREGLVLVQTPQVFERSLLERAYAQQDLTSTDDAALVERLGEPVLVIDGDPRNAKITTPADARALRAMLGLKGPPQRDTHKRF